VPSAAHGAEAARPEGGVAGDCSSCPFVASGEIFDFFAFFVDALLPCVFPWADPGEAFGELWRDWRDATFRFPALPMVTPPMARCDRRVKETRRRKADSTKGVQQKKKG